ncbi:hypothetical protein [Marinoscillum sp. MHG1-6]|uniref:hypothetical protein n=1 Tax=Marinoscillum sp. MHG1-6 TaxID=2959627 RepID=UPI0021588C8B|nr:hypothetical protein [Marinoscillum sp. MHG1-6]
MLLALIPFFFACNDPNELGVELDEQNSKTELKFIEFTLPSLTMLIDSLLTDNARALLLGRIKNDSTFGSVRARSFVKYQPDGGTLPDDSLELVRAFVRVKYSKALLASDIPRNDFTIYEAKDTLFSSVTYLANTPTPFDGTNPIGSVSELLDIYSDSLTEIDLSTELANSLFTKLELATSSDPDYLDSLNNRKYYYPALVFEPGDDNEALLTFDMTLDTVGLFVEMQDSTGINKYYYKFSLQEKNYSQVIRDRTGSKYATLTESYDVYDQPETTVKLNAAAGLYPLVDLQPYLDFLDSSENIIINKAEVTIKNNELSEFIPPVSQIRYLFADEMNKIDAQGALGISGASGAHAVLNNSGYLTGSTGSASLLTGTYSEDDLQYANEITLFSQVLLDQKLSDTDYISAKLAITNVNIHEVGYSSFPKSDIKLRVFYTKLK